MTDKNIDIKNRIANAKTTDELLALAAEIGEPMTLEQAEKLLAEIKVESQTAEQSFASEEDIPDAELEAVAGGSGVASWTENTHFSQFTYRDGSDVLIFFGYTYLRCQHWACNIDMSSNHYLVHTIKQTQSGQVDVYNKSCSVCNQKADCGACAYRVVQTGIFGPFYHDYCNNPNVRNYYGL